MPKYGYSLWKVTDIMVRYILKNDKWYILIDHQIPIKIRKNL
jgi:hypothetical protein